MWFVYPARWAGLRYSAPLGHGFARENEEGGISQKVAKVAKREKKIHLRERGRREGNMTVSQPAASGIPRSVWSAAA